MSYIINEAEVRKKLENFQEILKNNPELQKALELCNE
jgi:hypothetical protein